MLESSSYKRDNGIRSESVELGEVHLIDTENDFSTERKY